MLAVLPLPWVLSGPVGGRGVPGAGGGGVVVGGVGNRNMWRSVTVSGGVSQRVAFPDPLEPGSRAAEGRRSEPLTPAAVTASTRTMGRSPGLRPGPYPPTALRHGARRTDPRNRPKSQQAALR